MNHYASSRFWRLYKRLPKDIRDLADRNFALLKTDSAHPSLHFKKVGDLWSARVGLRYRALAVEVDADLVWFWIGSHAEYDTLVGRKRPAKVLPSKRRRRDGQQSR